MSPICMWIFFPVDTGLDEKQKLFATNKLKHGAKDNARAADGRETRVFECTYVHNFNGYPL